MPLPDPKNNPNRKLDQDIRPDVERSPATEKQEKPGSAEEVPVPREKGVKPIPKEDITPEEGS